MVYVDDRRLPRFLERSGTRLRMFMCRMTADKHSQLVIIAHTLGLNPDWIKERGTAYEHLEICQSQRALAVAAGAKEITKQQMDILLSNRQLVRRSAAI